MIAPVLEIRGLCKRFGGIVVAQDVNIDIAPGQVVGLVGPNGAGKTSLLNLVAGATRADSGSIWLNGERIDNISDTKRARLGVSRTWQHLRLFPSLTILENVLLASRAYPDELPTDALRPAKSVVRAQDRERALVQLQRMRLADAVNRKPPEMSFGKQKLIALARALMNDGDLMLLDEPMAGVEGPSYKTIQALIREEAAAGRAVCIVEHNLSFLRSLCDSAAFMFNGRIVATGSISDMVRDKRLAALYFGT